MTATQQTESAERIARPLIQLAKLNGISTSYIDQLGTYVEIRDEVLVSVLAALGVDASSDEAIAASYELTKQRIADTLVEPTIVKFIGKEATTPIRAKGHDVTLRLLLEDGTRYEGNLCMYLAPQTDGSLTLTLPDDIPAGYHTLRVNAGPLHGEARLICAPARVPLPPAVAEKQRWGWMAQMYSIRSAESWGVGDYGDLKLLLTDAAEKSHADFMLINPIHATAPVEPLDFTKLGTLEFAAPDTDTFRCLALARAAGERGGTLPCVMNAANEVAVAAFLAEEGSYLGIAACVEAVMDAHERQGVQRVESLDQLEELDAWARAEARRNVR